MWGLIFVVAIRAQEGEGGEPLSEIPEWARRQVLAKLDGGELRSVRSANYLAWTQDIDGDERDDGFVVPFPGEGAPRWVLVALSGSGKSMRYDVTRAGVGVQAAPDGGILISGQGGWCHVHIDGNYLLQECGYGDR